MKLHYQTPESEALLLSTETIVCASLSGQQSEDLDILTPVDPFSSSLL